MKLKTKNVSGQFLILILAAIILSIMVQVAQAQSSNQSLMIQNPQRSVMRKALSDTTLNYYTQFLGPTVKGAGPSYNVFQEAFTPYQNFHSLNLRYKINTDWAVGASLAASNSYGETVSSQQNGDRSKMMRDEFYNARLFLSVPSFKTDFGTLFTTVSYEFPTSVVARTDDMKFGLVLSQSFAFKMPSLKWTSGLLWQYYRAFYEENVVPPRNGYASWARQTTIVNFGPYLGYRFNDRWGVNSSVTFDWDQRGKQTGTGSFNNNLPDRARLGVSYYPTTIKQISNVGLFTQGLLKYTPETQVVGAELALSF